MIILALHVGTVCYLFSNFQSNLPSYNVDDLLSNKIEDDDNWTHDSDKQSKFTRNNYEIPWARVGKFLVMVICIKKKTKMKEEEGRPIEQGEGEVLNLYIQI